jgi:pyruvate-formate lyase-activating enzyme
MAEVIERLDWTSMFVLDTSGYADESSFRKVAAKSQLVYFDLKLINPAAHLGTHRRRQPADPAESPRPE